MGVFNSDAEIHTCSVVSPGAFRLSCVPTIGFKITNPLVPDIMKKEGGIKPYTHLTTRE